MLLTNSPSPQSECGVGGAWCAIYTRHQHEKAIAQILSAKGLEVFLPLYNATRRWKDRTMHLSLPLFPCYLFLRGMKERRLEVVTTPVAFLIGEDGVIVRDVAVGRDAILALLRDGRGGQKEE